MDLATFRALQTSTGQEALQAAAALHPRELDFLAHFQGLSKRFPRDLARVALDIAILRREGVGKFEENAQKLFFTREALEQASPAEVSAYRAEKFRHFDRVADLGCSIGSDTIALSRVAPVIGIDLDPLRLAMAWVNVRALGLANRAAFIQADISEPLPLSAGPSTGLFFDPARRSAGKRTFSVHQYQPPLDIITGWLPDFPALGVKISPGVNLEELASYDAEIEFISLRGELKEAALWFGSLKTGERRATILPGPYHLDEIQPPGSKISAPKSVLYEPDPAVIRAGFVTSLAEQLDAGQLDPDIAYLTAEKKIETPFARSWMIEDWMPFHLKKLRAYLRARSVGQVTVKKRGSPIQPEDLIRDLRLEGENEKILVLTHLKGQPVVLVCSVG